MPSYDRNKGEGIRAFEAFCRYRDLGPPRSLDRAWTENKTANQITNRRTRCPTHWQDWSRQWKWVERAASYDAHLHEEQRAVRTAKLREFENSAMSLNWRTTRGLRSMFGSCPT